MHRFLPTAAVFLICLIPAAGQEAVNSAEEQWLNNFQYVFAEQLLKTGVLAMEQGEFQLAEQNFSEAIQVIKVNNGLDSKFQIPALGKMIEALLAQRRWEAVDQQLGYFDWLNLHNYYKNIYDYLEGSKELSRLFLQASADYTNPQSARYLIAAKNLNWQVVSAIETTLGTDHQLLVPWLYEIVLIHSYQSSLIKRRGMTSYEFKSESESDVIVSGWSIGRNESLQLSYSIGNELLERIRSLYAAREDTSAATDAIMQVYLGDWELLFNNNRSALDHYRSARQALAEANLNADEIQQFFSKPTILPQRELNTEWPVTNAQSVEDPLRFAAWSTNYPALTVPSAFDSSEPSRFSVLATFNLQPLERTNAERVNLITDGSFGVHQLQIQNAVPDSGFVRDLAARSIRQLKIRPRLESGSFVTSVGIQLEYIFSPEEQALIKGNN